MTTPLSSPALSTLPFTVANSVKDGTFNSNFMYSTILSCIVVSVVTALVTKIDVVVTWMSSLFIKLYNNMSYWSIKIYNSRIRKRVIEPKTCVISLITEGRDINELYVAMEWYLTNNRFVDYTKESPINISYNKKFENLTEKEDVKLSQSINFGQTKYSSKC